MTALERIAAAVITVSDRCARGERTQVVPDGDESVAGAIRSAVGTGARVIITTGGTGVAPRDRTPEATRPLLVRELPGVAEELRRRGASRNPLAVLSRGLVGVIGSPPAAVVVNLPGSAAGVVEGLDVVMPLVPHVLEQLDGVDH